MSLREWLIAIGTLVIIGIVIDGVRRMRRARKESMAISSGMGADGIEDSPLDDEYNPELPNGGARTISRDTLEERGYVKREKTSRFGSPKPKPTRPVTAAAKSEKPESQEPEPQPESEPGAERYEESVESEPDFGLSSQEPDETEMIQAGAPLKTRWKQFRPRSRPKWKRTPPGGSPPDRLKVNLWQARIALRPAKLL